MVVHTLKGDLKKSMVYIDYLSCGMSAVTVKRVAGPRDCWVEKVSLSLTQILESRSPLVLKGIKERRYSSQEFNGTVVASNSS